MHINIIVNYKSFHAVIEDRKVHMPLAFYLYIDRHQVPTLSTRTQNENEDFINRLGVMWRNDLEMNLVCQKSNCFTYRIFFLRGLFQQNSNIWNIFVRLLYGTKSK